MSTLLRFALVCSLVACLGGCLKRPGQEEQEEPTKAEQPKAEQPKAEQPKAEQPKAEQPEAEQPEAEQPKPAVADDRTDAERRAAAGQELGLIQRAVDRFKADVGVYAEQLAWLWEKPQIPGAHKWKGPYLAQSGTTDPWGNAYVYYYVPEIGYEIVSYGKDGAAGGEGEAADVRITYQLKKETAEATEPEATETAEATEPEATETAEATQPEATEPEATEPEATEPEATEPEATEPEATEPEATETAEATEPEATEPEATPAPEGTGDPLVDNRARLTAEATADRVAAADALGGLGKDARPAIPDLVTAAKDPEWQVRQAAIRALGKIDPEDPAATEAITGAFEDPHPEVQAAAYEALQ